MDAVIHNITCSFCDWVAGVATKFNRAFHRAGYARAGAELRRLGYKEEAERCFKEMRKL